MTDSLPNRPISPELAIALFAGWAILSLVSSAYAQGPAPDYIGNTGIAPAQVPESSPKTLFRWAIGNPIEVEAEHEDSIVTDRPHFSEASSLVGKGHIQFESGYTFTNDSSLVSSLFGAAGDRNACRRIPFQRR